MKTHELRTWSKYFQPVLEDKKRFEIRLNDRDFQEGDLLILKEYDPITNQYSGREITVKVDYVLKEYPAVDCSCVVMSIRRLQMSKLTCRGCGKELENCTCDVLTTKKEQTEKLKLIEIYDPCIPCEKEHNGECFDMECHSNARYNAKVSGAKLQMESDQLVVDKLEAERDAAISQVGKLARELGQQDARIKDLESINESHQKLNRELRERIKELEELIPTKDEAEAYFRMDDYPACQDSDECSVEYCKECSAAYNRCIAKLQKIIDKRG